MAEEQFKIRFRRIRGRIVPIRVAKGSNEGFNRVSALQGGVAGASTVAAVSALAKMMSKKKLSLKRFGAATAFFTVAGALLGPQILFKKIKGVKTTKGQKIEALKAAGS